MVQNGTSCHGIQLSSFTLSVTLHLYSTHRVHLQQCQNTVTVLKFDLFNFFQPRYLKFCAEETKFNLCQNAKFTNIGTGDHPLTAEALVLSKQNIKAIIKQNWTRHINDCTAIENKCRKIHYTLKRNIITSEMLNSTPAQYTLLVPLQVRRS